MFIPISKVKETQDKYVEKIESDMKYSLNVDPLGTYGFCEEHKQFIKTYMNIGNVGDAADLCGISIEDALNYYRTFGTTEEINRISMAMYQRQFTTGLLDVDQIGGYLTSLIVNANMLDCDKLETKDKIKVAQMIIDLNILKQKTFDNPEIIATVEVKDQIQNMSAEEIRQILDKPKKDKDEKDRLNLVSELSKDLSEEEIDYLKGLSLEELMKIGG